MRDYFFYARAKDSSKEYSPESQIIIDVPTAVAFFGNADNRTLETIHERVQSLVSEWNSLFCTDEAVCLPPFFVTFDKPKYFFSSA